MEYVNLDIDEAGILNIAFLGDSIWELYVRKAFFNKGLSLKKLNHLVKEYVNAKFQSSLYNKIYDEIEEEEKNFSKRARNANIKHYPKSCTMKEYRESTAFEALIAYYYLNEKIEKIENIIKIYLYNGYTDT